jgi:hypothetical protein
MAILNFDDIANVAKTGRQRRNLQRLFFPSLLDLMSEEFVSGAEIAKHHRIRAHNTSFGIAKYLGGSVLQSCDRALLCRQCLNFGWPRFTPTLRFS